jgi:hypothetical protein
MSSFISSRALSPIAWAQGVILVGTRRRYHAKAVDVQAATSDHLEIIGCEYWLVGEHGKGDGSMRAVAVQSGEACVS